jgi:hypothetical protein
MIEPKRMIESKRMIGSKRMNESMIESKQMDESMIESKQMDESMIESKQSKFRYLDIVQMDPKQFNAQMNGKREEFKSLNGFKNLWNLPHDHELNAHRSTNYSLSDENLLKLENDGFVVQSIDGIGSSFGGALLDIYNNDLPVIITSDMMLFALHRAYDDSLKCFERDKMIILFTKMCKGMLDCLYSSQLPVNVMSDLEIYIMVPLMFLNIGCDSRYGSNKSKQLNPRYANINKIISIVNNLTDGSYQELELIGVKFALNKSSFKPRGHYTDSKRLSAYFRAFTWFTQIIVRIDPQRDDFRQSKLMATYLTYLAKPISPLIMEIESFVEQFIGKPDGWTLSGFLNLMTEQNAPMNSIQQLSDWVDNMILDPKDSCQFTKMGDMVGNETAFCFQIIGKGNQADNHVIQALVDGNYDNNVSGMRKYPSIFDVLYSLFHNPIVLDKIPECNTHKREKHIKYLDFLKNKYDNIPNQTLYGHELLMIRALSSMPEKAGLPFTSSKWLEKQAITQIGHYNELRHDNVLYVGEVFGGGLECHYPDIMVEPSLEFWKQYLSLVNKLIFSFKGLPKISEHFKKFQTTVEKIIEFLNLWLSGNDPPHELKEELKCIISKKSRGSGETIYTGWYPQLFLDPSKSVLPNSEVSSYFTGVPDKRDNGGIMHLGNGNPRIMYCVVNDKVFLGPVYEMYEVKTPYSVRYNDKEWKKEHNKYNPIRFN